MKINIGCGYRRLPGWVNVDRDPACRPDREAEAWDLPFEAGSAGEAAALHLVEHLGFFRTKYFLSECWRVLADGGRLALELPDVEETFRVFLGGDRAAREAALGWVYGSETAGMGHAYCPPRELLEELLAGAGFAVAEKAGYLYQPSRPALRYTAVKVSGERSALNAALRRRLLDDGIPAFGDEPALAGQEGVIEAVLDSHGSPEKIFGLALRCARIAGEYFVLAGENEQRAAPYAAACERLAGWGLQGRMAAAALEVSAGGAAAEEAYGAGLSVGRRALAAAAEGAPLPENPAPAAGAPAVFSELAVGDWLARMKALRGG